MDEGVVHPTGSQVYYTPTVSMSVFVIHIAGTRYKASAPHRLYRAVNDRSCWRFMANPHQTQPNIHQIQTNINTQNRLEEAGGGSLWNSMNSSDSFYK